MNVQSERTNVDVRTYGRGWAWFGFGLGLTASISANVAHATGTGPRLFSAFFPVALLASVEILARVQWPDSRTFKAWAYAGTFAVAVVCAIVSYRHMSALLATYGEGQLVSILGPLGVDGVLVVSSMALLSMGRTNVQARTDDAHRATAERTPELETERTPELETERTPELETERTATARTNGQRTNGEVSKRVRTKSRTNGGRTSDDEAVQMILKDLGPNASAWEIRSKYGMGAPRAERLHSKINQEGNHA